MRTWQADTSPRSPVKSKLKTLDYFSPPKTVARTGAASDLCGFAKLYFATIHTNVHKTFRGCLLTIASTVLSVTTRTVNSISNETFVFVRICTSSQLFCYDTLPAWLTMLLILKICYSLLFRGVVSWLMWEEPNRCALLLAFVSPWPCEVGLQTSRHRFASDHSSATQAYNDNDVSDRMTIRDDTLVLLRM